MVKDNSDLIVIKLSGSLARKFGRTHCLSLDSGRPVEGIHALTCSLPGFRDELLRLDGLGMQFALFRNKNNVGQGELLRRGATEIRIVPVIGGSKRAGVLQTVLGIVLILLSAPTGGATLAPGIGLVASGVIQMLSPQPTGLRQSASPENLPSYAFGSARNTTASGNNIPICIGERRWGGSIISASIYAEDRA